MKIGIFDSGVGGLIVARALRRELPRYTYIYLGDTKNLPYGEKSQAQIYRHTVKAVEYLFKKDCALVVIACNTVSAQALRRIQQEWLPKSQYKERRVLGVIRPTVELSGRMKSIGVIGTSRTADSGIYAEEFKKINKKIKLTIRATPKLVGMVEAGYCDEKILGNYLAPFRKVDGLVLGCTHYGFLKKEIQKILGKKVKIIAQEDLLPGKLKEYLKNHPEIKEKLSQTKKRSQKFELLVTKLTDRYEKLAREWFGGKSKPKLVRL